MFKCETRNSSNDHVTQLDLKISRGFFSDFSDESPSEDESQSEEESEEESESEEEVYVKPKKGSKKSAKKPPKKIKKIKKPTHPPVGEMFVTAIKRLKDHPRKGSSMAAIKGT